MMTTCPECGLQVSDKAAICPHCGFPLKSEYKYPSRRSNKPKRLPNGFGQITKIKNKKLRNPYRVMVNAGKREDGRYISVLLKPKAYFPTYNDAYQALVEFNKSPCDLMENITTNQLFDRWYEYYYSTHPELSRHAKARTKNCWKYCTSVYDVPVKELRIRHIRYCMENGTHTYRGVTRNPEGSTKQSIKTTFNLMLDYAVEYDLVTKNVSRELRTRSDRQAETKKPHFSFTKEEMQLLWNNLDKVPYVDVVLFQCFTGWRPEELCLLRVENLDLSNWTIMGGEKTENGRDRIVPIHNSIRAITKNLYDKAMSLNSEWLITCPAARSDSVHMTYYRYHRRFINILSTLGLNSEHRPHDPRKQFITMAKEAGVDEYAIKRIVGHAINDLTESVYTDRSIEWLQKEIDKISV